MTMRPLVPPGQALALLPPSGARDHLPGWVVVLVVIALVLVLGLRVYRLYRRSRRPRGRGPRGG